jgi:hypothetical protein
MANAKVSALTAATTPLAGTEVLPIVQSGVTVKVANNDLRPKQIQSNATSGVLQVAGPTAAATRVMTTPDANFTAARTDAANSFTGDQTLSTGNLIQGTAAKGVNFTANTPATGMTSQLLNWYEQGTWTPTQGFGLTVVGTFSSSGTYTRIGRQVTVIANLNATTSVTASAGGIACAGLPFSVSGASVGSLTTNALTQSSSASAYLDRLYSSSATTAATGLIITATYFV